MVTVAEEMLIVGTEDTLNTWAELIVTGVPVGDVIVIVTLTGCEPEIAPLNVRVSFRTTPAGIAPGSPDG